jgi:hypothetical protein
MGGGVVGDRWGERIAGLVMMGVTVVGAACFVVFVGGHGWWPRALIWPGITIAFAVVGHYVDRYDRRSAPIGAVAGFVGGGFPAALHQPAWWWTWIPLLLAAVAFLGFSMSLPDQAEPEPQDPVTH